MHPLVVENLVLRICNVSDIGSAAIAESWVCGVSLLFWLILRSASDMPCGVDRSLFI